MKSRLPPWLTIRLGQGDKFRAVRRVLAAQGLNTVCAGARCPNLGECWSAGTATFMILGDTCTRNCRFCAVPGGIPKPLDPDEPAKIAWAVRKLGLTYAVITSVTRDDLPDGGASVFAETIRSLKREVPGVRVEVLIPDFKGDEQALDTVLTADPDVLNHNVETVPRLYPRVRPRADYGQSIRLLARASARLGDRRTKSGLMLGLGEIPDELTAVLEDLRRAGTGRLTLGQYLQPTKSHRPVTRYLPPEEFDRWGETAREMGFTHVASGPLVRSSYHAADMDPPDISILKPA